MTFKYNLLIRQIYYIIAIYKNNVTHATGME